MDVVSSPLKQQQQGVCCKGGGEDSDYEDEQIRRLEQGSGQNYFGSQSLLSQEMQYQGGGLSQDTIGNLSQVSVNSSENFDSQQLVQQYGLLSQGDRPASQGGFGTLLDAVSMFQSQEEEQEQQEKRAKIKKEKEEEQAKNAPVIVDNSTTTTNNLETTNSQDSVETTTTTTAIKTRAPSKRPTRKPTLPLKRNSGNSSNIKKTTPAAEVPPRKRKRKDEDEQAKLQEQANRAADLAQRTINDPELAKRLLLSMALTRENPRSAPETLPGPGHVLPEGFFWAHYPPLEKVLKDNMAEYYELSITKCQSAQQQSFNNTLVLLVRNESDRLKWEYASCFTDKILRDRIRCYYKTHIQNAKKRLRTMIKNPTKKANARHLCSHLDMIEQNVHTHAADDVAVPETDATVPATTTTTIPTPTGTTAAVAATTTSTTVDPATNTVITHKDWGSSFAGDIAKAAGAIAKPPPLEERVAVSVVAMTAKSLGHEETGKVLPAAPNEAEKRPTELKAFPNRGRHSKDIPLPPLETKVKQEPETSDSAMPPMPPLEQTVTPAKEAPPTPGKSGEAVVASPPKSTNDNTCAVMTPSANEKAGLQKLLQPSPVPSKSVPVSVSMDSPAVSHRDSQEDDDYVTV
ncbi:expressed unknown protein [Seminavis robusta]|uniref:Uncharacterized protein n=1 Tax=Seminavis robusta TaxID=568900 RepID=A0A9N8H9Y5_9STRA|nr:expressed unknown protein [Seminavis robusta]|eukprot:Sro272_g104790.1 n/a (630) ;mRNA; r:14494-16494